MTPDVINYEEEIKALSEKVAVPYDEIYADFSGRVEKFVGFGVDEEKAKKTSFKQIKGSFQAALKSQAKTIEGIFIGITQKRNKNKFIYDNCVKELEEYKQKHGENWETDAINEGILNNKGQFLYHKGNTTAAQAWMIGQIIKPEDLEKVGYGFFRIVGPGMENAPLKQGVIHISNPDSYYPEIGMMYKFRANCSKPDAEPLQMRTANVTKFVDPVLLDYDIIHQYIESYHGFITFDEAWNHDGSYTIKYPDGVRFYTSEVTVVGINVSEKTEVDFIDLQSLTDGDTCNDNITMPTPRYQNNAFETAVGIAVYRPYYTKAKENETERKPSGELIGFLINNSFGEAPPKEIKEIHEDDFE